MSKVNFKNFIGWLGAVLVLVGYVFNTHENIACWPIWILGNTLVGIYSLQKRAHSTAAMSFALVLLSFYGWIRWSF